MGFDLAVLNRLRRMGTVATVFSPVSLFAASEPGVWYDPSDLTTMFQDTAGTTPVTTPGQTVARMNDKSGRGNNATQATTASRPTYGIVPLGGRRNLLTRTEEFNDSYWTKSNSAITANADGVADLVYPLTSGTLRGVERSLGAVSSAAHTISIEAKASGLNFLYLYGAQGNVVAYFNLSTGAVGTVGSGLTATITNVGGGYYRCTVTQTVTNLFIYAGGCDANGSTQATASGTNGILIRNIQLELGSTATAYQRVTTQYDVTESGVQSLSYLSFDGVDDFLVTPTITPGIDKVQVFAGVRKLSDAGAGVIVEHSLSISSMPGSFYLLGPRSVSTTYDFTSRGSVLSGTAFISGYTAPITNILTGLGDISGDIQTLRVNGTQVAQDTADQGTGNFLAYPIYIGRRAGTTLPFNGQIYNMIVRFGANLDAGTITSTETFVAGKTGVTL